MPDLPLINLNYLELESIDVGRILKDDETHEVPLADILAPLAKAA
jgi:hypothetical protein